MRVLIACCVASSVVAQSDIDDTVAAKLLSSIYPGSTVSFVRYDASLGQCEGRVDVPASGDHGFYLRNVLLRSQQNPKWDAFLLTPNFGESDSVWIRSYLSGKKDKPTTIITPKLLVSPKGGESVATHVDIGDDSLTVDLSRAEIGSLIGDRTEQLLLTYRAVFYVDKPREIVVTTMADLYQMPSLDLVFRGLLGKEVTDITGNVYEEMPMSTLTFVGPTSGEFRDIVITSAKNEQVRYAYDGERYLQDSFDPDQRSTDKVQERLRLKALFETEKTLSIRVVNEAGAPVVGARVSGETREPTTLMNLEPPRKALRGETDERGEFSVGTPGSILIEIEAEGYYKITRNWTQGRVPAETQIIVLEGAPEEVSMFPFSVSKVWKNQPLDRIEVGVRIEETIGSNYPLEGDRENADMWFLMVKTRKTISDPGSLPGRLLSEYNTSSWQITITARNGWSIAPGPEPQSGKTADSLMRVAPKAGYQTQLEFTGRRSPPHSFFIRLGDGQRYGKVSEFDFNDFTMGDIPRYELRMTGFVQSEETRSTSLNGISAALMRIRRLQRAGSGTAAIGNVDGPARSIEAVQITRAATIPTGAPPPAPTLPASGSHTASSAPLSQPVSQMIPPPAGGVGQFPYGRARFAAIMAGAVAVLLILAAVYRMKLR